MPKWKKPLPGEAIEGRAGHQDDHNKIRDALIELRVGVDEVEDARKPTMGTAAALAAGTDTTPRLWSAKTLHEEIARQIGG